MKLRELIAAIDPTKADKWQNAFWGFEDIGNELNVGSLYDSDYDKFDHIKQFPLHTWQCTDTMVGYNALFLNGEFICVTFQRGRKWDVNYFWASPEMAEKTRQYLISAIPPINDNLTYLSESDLDIDPTKQ